MFKFICIAQLKTTTVDQSAMPRYTQNKYVTSVTVKMDRLNYN